MNPKVELPGKAGKRPSWPQEQEKKTTPPFNRRNIGKAAKTTMPAAERMAEADTIMSAEENFNKEEDVEDRENR